MSPLVAREGERFGRLLVVGAVRRGDGRHRWRCACDCGAESFVADWQLRMGRTISCGCYKRELASRNCLGRQSEPGVPDEVRFWSRVQVEIGGCWLWTGRVNQLGYGRFGTREQGATNRLVSAHRTAYELTRGDIPAGGLELDHLCRVRNCVNPAHLEPVTRAENNRRSREALGAGR